MTRGRAWPLLGIVGVVALALAIRLSLLVRSGWLLEGDDALSTLMALGVRDGERPIMLKNQTYAAAWEPYAMAVAAIRMATGEPGQPDGLAAPLPRLRR